MDNQPLETQHQVPITLAGGEPGHLALRLSRPEKEAIRSFCFVFTHGFGATQNDPKISFLRDQAVKDGCAFASFDFQGHGESSGAICDITISRNIEDIEAVRRFLRRQGYSRIVLCGWSMGASTIMWYAAEYPGRVVANIALSPGFQMQREFLRWVGPERARQWVREGVIRFETDWISCDLAWDLIADLEARDETILRARYRTPTLILHGLRDEVVPWLSVVEFIRECPYGGIDFHLFSDGGHRLMDRKERLWKLMHEFLCGRRIVCW